MLVSLFNSEAVVRAVLTGTADFGFVAMDTLEMLTKAGAITAEDAAQLEIIDKRNDTGDYPFQ